MIRDAAVALALRGRPLFFRRQLNITSLFRQYAALNSHKSSSTCIAKRSSRAAIDAPDPAILIELLPAKERGCCLRENEVKRGKGREERGEGEEEKGEEKEEESLSSIYSYVRVSSKAVAPYVSRTYVRTAPLYLHHTTKIQLTAEATRQLACWINSTRITQPIHNLEQRENSIGSSLSC